MGSAGPAHARVDRPAALGQKKKVNSYLERSLIGLRPPGSAEVAELADAHGSGPCTRKGVGVRVPSSAPYFLGFKARGARTTEPWVWRGMTRLHILAGVPATLEQIVANARKRLEERRTHTVLGALELRAAEHVPRGFAARLREVGRSGPAVIAELKKASPSRGVIRGSLHVASLARELETGGAAALSVLTDEDYFQGSLSYLDEAEA